MLVHCSHFRTRLIDLFIHLSLEAEKNLQRKFRFRSASAHQLNAANQTSSITAKQVRSFSLRTLSDTRINNERNMAAVQRTDGFDIENIEESEGKTGK